ncbi:MAG: response regulator [Desulfatiglandaceae bacterium]|jgi:DNA-binding NtrC family response regulator
MPESGSDEQGMTMKHQYTILIADRNPHVRAFLKREMTAEGYQIRLANTGREVLQGVFGHDPLHLLIIDPDLPDVEEPEILKKLESRIPALPIIVHSFTLDYARHSDVLDALVFVEKGGKSIERLKSLAAEMLQKDNPRHLETPEEKKLPQGENLHEAR